MSYSPWFARISFEWIVHTDGVGQEANTINQDVISQRGGWSRTKGVRSFKIIRSTKYTTKVVFSEKWYSPKFFQISYPRWHVGKRVSTVYCCCLGLLDEDKSKFAKTAWWWGPRMVGTENDMSAYDRAMGNTLLTIGSLTIDIKLIIWWVVLCHVKLNKLAAMAHEWWRYKWNRWLIFNP